MVFISTATQTSSGTGVIQLAFSGNDEVKIVVSFHGGLTDLPFPQVDVTPYTLMYVLYCPSTPCGPGCQRYFALTYF